jgi:putative tricarboxylic transport membrane protein
VRNIPGAGGGVAFAHTVADRRRDPNVIIAASPATTLRLAEKQFGRFQAEDVRWLAAVAGDYGAIAVRDDAPWGSSRR